MKKKKKRNNKIIILIGLLLIVLLVLFLITSSFFSKEYDLVEVEKVIDNYYSEIEVETKNDEDLMLYFGLSIDDSVLLMSNFNPNEDIKDISEPNLLLIINKIDKDKVNEYYDALKAFTLSYTERENDKEELVKLYESSILKKGDNYVYYIIGTKNIEMEEDLNKLYK